tara:strand:- start:50 stop:817 length:768 start_codon:yes stop_codon:yes gene_type:complete
MSGWIKLHRQIEQNWVWQRPHTLRLFAHLLLGAATQSEAIYRNLHTGQIRTTYAALSEALKYGPSEDRLKSLSRRELGRMIADLVEASMIGCESSTGGLLISVSNYDSYQGGRTASSQRAPVDTGWMPDTSYDSAEALQRWTEIVGSLPHRVHAAAAQNALARLHSDDHYSAEEIYRAIDQLAEHRNALGWVTSQGPERLRKLTKNKDLTMDIVLAWTKKENENGKRKLYSRSTTEAGTRTGTGTGTDGLAIAAA